MTTLDCFGGEGLEMSPSSHTARKTVGLGLVGVLLLAVGTTSASAADLIGVPRIIDGDTVEISGVKVRLEGIDAPETDQFCLDDKSQPRECGKGVRYQLINKSAGRPWTCRVSGQDVFHRSLASCYIDGEDIQRWMVRSGLALSFKRYSHKYDADEAAAREARAGLWSGAFIAPWDWRSRNKSTEILGAVSVPIDAQKVLLRPDPRGSSADTPALTPTATPSPTPKRTASTTTRTSHKATGRCRNASDTAANGSRCGKRAASERRGKGRHKAQ
jgi:endonuclease YncB( thermonuclease family)